MSTFSRAFELAHFLFPQGGTCLEFGVYAGGTYCWQAQRMLDAYKNDQLVGYDSWQGLPPEADGVWAPDRHAAGRFASPKECVLSRLSGMRAIGPRFRLVDGFFKDSLTEAERCNVGEVIFINIDVDIYSSTIELLNFVEPLLRPGVVLYWDDWQDPNDDHPNEWGERKAWHDWISQHSQFGAETMEVNAINQRTMMITKTPTATMDHGRIADIRYRLVSMSQ